MENDSTEGKPRSKRQKETQEQKLSKIELKDNEKVRLSKVFDQLCAYRKCVLLYITNVHRG
jgi:hypothetical protein